jgi:anaerobic magnesium-protoporphyrin IX monomethyl ester cyclase
MKIILIHPPHLNSTDDRLDPPLGLLYIAAHLRLRGHTVIICDLSGQSDIRIPVADIYGITAYVSTLNITRKIISVCRAMNSKAKIVVGGAHASARPEDFPEADYVVQGYGEDAMLHVLETNLKQLTIIGQEPRDLFIFPAYDLINTSTYHRTIAGRPSLPVVTSRGCPFKCSFCGLAKMHQLGFGVRMASPETVYSHIKRIKDQFGITRINFQDDIFTFNHKRLFRLLDLITPLGIKFRCHGRAGYDTKEVYQRLAMAGCDQVAWGIESGSQYILNRMNKQSTVEDNFLVIQWAKKYGITSRAFIIIGFPGETEETLRETKQFINNADPDQVFVSNFVPYPGTDVGDNLSKYGITNVSSDLDQYYQVSKDGTGGLTIDTEWLTRSEFRRLELGFRDWLRGRPIRGGLLDYEIRQANEQEGGRYTSESNFGLHGDRDLRVQCQ